jgi:hypothetical protein
MPIENPDIPQLFPFKYQQQLQAHVEMAERIEHIANKSDNDFIRTITAEGVQRAEVLFEALNSRAGLNAKLPDSSRAKIAAQEESKARAYPKIIANQTLVLMCTTLDVYLQSAMKTILDEDKSAIQALCKPKDITVERAIELAGDGRIIDKIKSKILDRFDFGGIEDKIKDLGDCRINMDKAFSLSKTFTSLPKSTTSQEGRAILLNAYKMRHNIVHKGALPIGKSSDLIGIQNYFNGFMFKFASLCMETKGISNDFYLLVGDVGKMIK